MSFPSFFFSPSLCLCFSLSVCLSVCLSLPPSLPPSIHPSIHPTPHPRSLSLSLSLSLSPSWINLRIDCLLISCLFQLAEDAGFPPGVINTVTCSRDQVPSVTDVMLKSDLVSKLSFTGSTATGKVYSFTSFTKKKDVKLHPLIFNLSSTDSDVQMCRYNQASVP